MKVSFVCFIFVLLLCQPSLCLSIKENATATEKSLTNSRESKSKENPVYNEILANSTAVLKDPGETLSLKLPRPLFVMQNKLPGIFQDSFLSFNPPSISSENDEEDFSNIMSISLDRVLMDFIRQSQILNTNASGQSYDVSRDLSRRTPTGFGLRMNGISTFMQDISQLLKAAPNVLPPFSDLFRNDENITDDEATNQCYEDLDTFIRDLIRGKLWALNMLDASGKPSASLLEGNLQFVGNFDECLTTMSVMDTSGRSFKGDTCVVNLALPQQFKTMIGNQLLAQAAVAWHVCVPETCGGPLLKNIINKGVSQLGLNVKTVECHADFGAKDLSNDHAAVTVIVVAVVLAVCVLIGTILDLSLRACSVSDQVARKGHSDDVTETSNAKHQKENPPKKPFWQRLVLCFSAISNSEKIMSVKRTPGSLTCLNGIRVLSICWVILGHTFGVHLQSSNNPLQAQKMLQTLSFQVIVNGTLSVDSFFVLSGVLVTYLFLRECDKAGGVTGKNLVLYYVHRYLRLTPGYAFSIALYTYLVVYMADGPMWKGPGDMAYCKDHWWTNILYISNLYMPAQKQVSAVRNCFGWGWYLANDMQLFFIAPLALVPMALGNKKTRFGRAMRITGICVTVLLVITSIVATWVIDSRHPSDSFHGDRNFYYKEVYTTPWCRAGTYAIGMLAGYILYTKKCNLQISHFLQGLGWLTALVLAGAATLSTYDEMKEGSHPWSDTGRVAHEALFRPAWGIMLAWVILMCCTGKGGPVDWMLSWPWWQPLARLTYGAYLIHLVIMSVMTTAVIRTPINFTASYIVVHFCGYASLSYMLAFLLAVIVEAPALQLEKLLISG